MRVEITKRAEKWEWQEAAILRAVRRDRAARKKRRAARVRDVEKQMSLSFCQEFLR